MGKRIIDLTTASNLTGEEFLAVDDGSADGTTQKTTVNNILENCPKKIIQQNIGGNSEIEINVGVEVGFFSFSLIFIARNNKMALYSFVRNDICLLAKTSAYDNITPIELETTNTAIPTITVKNSNNEDYMCNIVVFTS